MNTEYFEYQLKFRICLNTFLGLAMIEKCVWHNHSQHANRKASFRWILQIEKRKDYIQAVLFHERYLV